MSDPPAAQKVKCSLPVALRGDDLASVRPEIEMVGNLRNKMQESDPKIELADGFARCIY